MTTNVVGSVGLVAAFAIAPVAYFLGGWFLVPLMVACAAIIWLWRPA